MLIRRNMEKGDTAGGKSTDRSESSPTCKDPGEDTKSCDLKSATDHQPGVQGYASKPGSDLPRLVPSFGDGSTNVLKLFLCNAELGQVKKSAGHPQSAALPGRRKAHLKPILLKRNDKQRKKRGCSLEGGASRRKRVHFDSKVAVRALHGALEYTRALGGGPGAYVPPCAAAPLCDLAELESFQREVDGLPELDAVAGEKGCAADGANLCQLAGKLPSNQSTSERCQSGLSERHNRLTSDPGQSRAGATATVLPADGSAQNSESVPESVDGATSSSGVRYPPSYPERSQPATTAAAGQTEAGLILSSVSRSASRTLDDVVCDPENEGRAASSGAGDIQRSSVPDSVGGEYHRDAGVAVSTTCLREENVSRNDADISANDRLSFDSGSLIRTKDQRARRREVRDPGERAAVVIQPSTGRLPPSGKSGTVCTGRAARSDISGSEPNKNGNDWQPDGRVNRDIHQRSLVLPRILQDGGNNKISGCSSRLEGDKHLASESLVGDRSGSVSVTGLGRGERTETELRSKSYNGEEPLSGAGSCAKCDDEADKTSEDDAFRLEVGQNAPCTDKYNLAGETRQTGRSSPGVASRWPGGATGASRTHGVDSLGSWECKSRTWRYCSVDKLDSSNMDSGAQAGEVSEGHLAQVELSQDDDVVGIGAVVSSVEETSSSSAEQRDSERRPMEVTGDGEAGSRDIDPEETSASQRLDHHAQCSGSEAFPINESRERKTEDVTMAASEPAATVESKLDIDIVITERGSCTNLESSAMEQGQVISATDQTLLAPLACEEEEEEEDGVTETSSEDGTPSVGDQRAEAGDQSDACASGFRDEGRRDSFAETDFTEDSERTFVVNTDADDDGVDTEATGEVKVARPKDDRRGVVDAAEISMAEKFKMISQSGVLPGRSSLRAMLEQRAKLSCSSKQNLSRTEVNKDDVAQVGTEHPGQGLGDEAVTPTGDDDGEAAVEAGTKEIPADGADHEVTDAGEEPCRSQPSAPCFAVAEVPSGSMAAILDVAGADEEVDMSTLERKRKRAKSEEKTSSSHGVFAESAISQMDVEEAMKKLRKSSEDGLHSRPESQPAPANRRRYDWNTYHFFPDIHDVDAETTIHKRRSRESIYSQYIEEEWLQSSDVNSKDSTMDVQPVGDEEQNEASPDSKPGVPEESDESAGSSSCDGDDSPKVWRKNPLLVRRKKKSERRLSAEFHQNTATDDGDQETRDISSKPGYESPSFRSRRSPRRHSSPNRNRAQRKNSDLIQEKVEKFQELQRRRRALESNSEESLAVPKKQGQKFRHQRSEGNGIIKVTDLIRRSHSQEDICYESRTQTTLVHSELARDPQKIKNTQGLPLLNRTQHQRGPGYGKSQYDFLSTEVQNIQSVRQDNVYTPEHDKRKALKDHRNASSSFENIYDAVDLSVDASSVDMDVSYYSKPDVTAASSSYHVYKQQPSNAAAQTGHQPIQVHIDARQLPAKVSVDPNNVPVLASAALHPSSHLDDVARHHQQQQQQQQQPVKVKQSMTSTSPVWYVPKPQQQYDIPAVTPEKKQKKLDAKALIEEEKKKFEDYKREYVRRLSERDSNSGASGDEQRHDAEPKHRVIPPDDYEYILRKIHHKRQDAYYAESTSQYRDQSNKSEAERLKYSILMKKQQQQQQQQQQALQQHSAVPITTQAPTAGKSPTKLYLDSLNLPSVHERSTSQLSTESSRELEQYFIPSKQKQTDLSQPVNQSWADNSQKHKQQQEGKMQQPKEQLHKASVVVNLDNSELAEPDIIREGSLQTLLTDVNHDNERWLSYQNQVRSKDGNELEKKPSAVPGLDADRPGQYLPSKPPVPKQDDTSTSAPSQWNYNTAYSPDRAYSGQPSVVSSVSVPEKRETLQQTKPLQRDVPDEQQTGREQQQSGQEKYGLVLRVTPQGAIASSPGADKEVSLPVRPVQSWEAGDRPRYSRPLSSSFLEYNPERRVYESEQIQGSRDHQQGLYSRQKGRHSQEDFQQLKDGLHYKEKHVAPFRGHSLGRDRPGPSKTPPPLVGQYDQQRSPPVGWDPRQLWNNYQLERRKAQPAAESQPSEASRHSPRQRHDSLGDSSWPSLTHGYQVDQLRPGQYQQELPLVSDKERPNISQKSWSMRINEVESMKPPSSRDQSGSQMELARSFAVVAISDKNKEKATEQKVPFKSYEDKVRQYCQESRSSPRELPQPSLASTQYEEHVKRSQERYRAEKHASVETGSEKPVYPPSSQKTDYVDPTFIRQRKASNENIHASSLQNLPLLARDPLLKEPSSSASDPDMKRSYGLQIQVEKPKPEAKSSEICLKLSRSREDLSGEKPNISIDSIKDKLFGNSIDKGSEASFKEELEKLWERHDRKVSAIQTEIFSAKDSKMPQYQSYATSSVQGYDDDNDQRLLYYVSYKDGQARKRSNIYDVLTDLERTYEQLDLDDENLLTAAERREYVSNVMARAPSSTRPDQHQQQTLAPESTEPNVKRLSITNLKKLEDLQKEQDTNPSLEYAKRWLEEDKSRVITASQSDPGFIESPTAAPAPAPSESETSCSKLASLPRKVKDDMAFRRQNPPTGNTSSHQDLPTVSYLAKSPSVSPSQSVESLSKRSCRSHTPDRTRDDLMLRNLQRAKSPGVSETDPRVLALRSPTSTDYLNERTTEPARGRMRLRPERQADKYHDDLAYRKLRKDIPPVVAELPDAYYRMKGVDSRLRTRSQSLERVGGERRSRETRRAGQPLERSQSLGPGQRPSTERQPSLSKGISYMVEFFSQPVTRTQSAPDLTEQSIFGESYNEQGDLISDDPRYAKYAQKPKKQQTPRTVKLRHEMKSKMRQIKHSADSGYMEQSESDASHSSSGPETRSPPDGNFDTDDHELQLSDTSSDKEARKDAQKKHISTTSFTTSTVQRSDAFSHIKFIDDGDEQNGNNTNNNNNKNNSNNRLVTKQDIPLPPKDLPHHTFVLSLPGDLKTTQLKQEKKQNFEGPKPDVEWLDKRDDATQPKYQPQFYPPRQSPIKQATASATQQQRQQPKEIFQPAVQKSTTPHQPTDKQQFIGDTVHLSPDVQTPRHGGPVHKQTIPNVSKLPSERFYEQRARFLKDIPAAASQFKAKRQLLDVGRQMVDMNKQDWPGVVVREANYRQPQQGEAYPPQQMADQWSPQQVQQKPIYQQQAQQKMTYQTPAQQSMGYQPQAQQTPSYQQQAQQQPYYQPQSQQKPSYQQQLQQKPTYQPQAQQKISYQPKKQLDPYYPQQYQQIENARQLQQPVQSYGMPGQQEVPNYENVQQDFIKSTKSEERGQTKLAKPAPPTRVSSLIHEPYAEEPSQSPPPSVNTQQPAQRMAPSDQSYYGDRRSWHAPISQPIMQKVEIVQPATIETRTSKDMERHIKEVERRSWHEQKEEPDDGKQVKLEFAFKAPEGTQFMHGLPGSKSLEQVHMISTSVADAKPTSASTSLQMESGLLPGSQVTQTYLPPASSARQQSKVPPAKASSSHDSKSHVTRSKVELPVIYSQPRNAAAAAAASVPAAASGTPPSEPPSYTVAPIIKKSQKTLETKDTSAAPATVTAVAKQTLDVGNTKSKNSQQIQLRDITQIIRDPAGKKPTSKLRTTQIQVVTSTLLPPEAEGDDEPGWSAVDETTQRTSEGLSVSSTEPQSSTSSGTPVVVVTTFDKSNREDGSTKARISLQSSAKQDPSSSSNQEDIVQKKRPGSLQDKGFGSGLSASRHPVKESYLSSPSSLLSPTSPLSPTERSAHSPMFSPPPRRAGTEHFELSDGEMTDATDITLDGLVRSNMYRPSSPETIDFSDFADNFSETASDISPQEVKRIQFLSRTRGETVLKQTATHSQQKLVHTTTNISSNRTLSQKSENTKAEQIVRSTETCKVTEEDSEPNLSFKDLVKSFEAKTNPFKHVADDSPHRSSSTDELPSKVKADTRKSDKTIRVLKQISGSDPNLSKMNNKAPSWRRL